jgi:hypothetical protein
MQQLQSGQHFGAAKKILRLEGTILTEAGYTPHIEVPWHYHENAYFFTIKIFRRTRFFSYRTGKELVCRASH